MSTLKLQRLSGREAEEIIRELIARAAVPGRIQKHIVERGDGIPLFIEELTQMVLESESLQALPDANGRGGPAEIPATLQSSLMARLDRLGRAKQIAQMAAVIGREFSLEVLQLWDTASVPGIRDEDLRAALVRLTDAGLIHAHAQAPSTFVFKHVLLQEAAYHSMLKRTRRGLHARIVHVLREHFPQRVQAQPEMVARHAEAANLGDEAVALYERAAEQAAARSAHEEALLQLRRALSVLGDLAGRCGARPARGGAAARSRRRVDRGAWLRASRNRGGLGADARPVARGR